MAVKRRIVRIQPGDGFAPVIPGAPSWLVCNGTIQAIGDGIELGYLGSDQVFIELNALSSWNCDGQDLTGLTARQKTAGGTAAFTFVGTIHTEGA